MTSRTDNSDYSEQYCHWHWQSHDYYPNEIVCAIFNFPPSAAYVYVFVAEEIFSVCGKFKNGTYYFIWVIIV